MNIERYALLFLCFLAVLSILPFNCVQPAETSRITLAEYINLSVSSVKNWTCRSGCGMIQTFARGLVLGKKSTSDIDTLVTRCKSSKSYLGVFCAAQFADLLNYSSNTIDDSIKWALNFTPMFKNYSIPKTQTNPDYFSVWNRVVLYGFQYSRELNCSTDKWNASSALAGFVACRETYGKAFYRFNPDTLGFDINPIDGTRWMSVANLADCFMILYRETNNQTALDYALQEWQDLNDYYWSGGSHYKYGRKIRFNPVEYEWSAIEVFFIFEKLRLLNGTLDNWTRVYTDLQDRYLSEVWDSPQWLDKVVRHSNKGSQKRLHGTLDAWLLMHTYFGNFSFGNQTNYQNMLEGNGVTQAWQALLNTTTGLYNSTTHCFKMDSDLSEASDYATAEGCIALFMMGMSVQSGQGLMIPKRCYGYSGEPFPVDVFRFYNDINRLIIPVYGGTTIEFMYGSGNVTYTFPESDIYCIVFSSDWNEIRSVTHGDISLEPESSDYSIYVGLVVIALISITLLYLAYRKRAKHCL